MVRSLRFWTFGIAALAISLNFGCSVFATRPVQEMLDTSSAIRAAREVQADTLAPELYRQASEWFFKAKTEYRLKNFSDAKNFATKARRFAEQAEFEALRNGATRTADAPPPPSADQAPKKAPYPYPTSTGVPAENFAEPKPQEGAPPAPAQTPGAATAPNSAAPAPVPVPAPLPAPTP